MQDSDSAEAPLPCAEKLAFDTQQQALATATTSEYWYGNKPHAYVCRYCGLWHLSSSPRD